MNNPEWYDSQSSSWKKTSPLPGGRELSWGKQQLLNDLDYVYYLAHSVKDGHQIGSNLSLKIPTDEPNIIESITLTGIDNNVAVFYDSLGHPTGIDIYEDFSSSPNYVYWQFGIMPIPIVRDRWIEMHVGGKYSLIDLEQKPQLTFWQESGLVMIENRNWGKFISKVNISDIPLGQILSINPQNWGRNEVAGLMASQIDVLARKTFQVKIT